MKPIFITNNLKEQAMHMFKEYITKLTKCPNGAIDFKANLDMPTPNNVPNANLVFTQKAYLKTMLYVRDTNTEIAWHGTVTHTNTNTYLVHDVFLYPQSVTGATVSTDQAQYNKWIEELDDDTFNKMRLQGHSHVNFGATPSGTDREYYNGILNVLNKEDFYIFMIINKSGQEYFEIYDLKNNIIYENQDIEIKIADDESDLYKLIDLDKQYFCTKAPPQYPTYNPAYTDKTKNWRETRYDYTELDELYADLDAKYNTLSAPKKKKKEKKKNESK